MQNSGRIVRCEARLLNAQMSQLEKYGRVALFVVGRDVTIQVGLSAQSMEMGPVRPRTHLTNTHRRMSTKP